MVLVDKKSNLFSGTREYKLLCSSLTPVSEWKSWLFQEPVWDESNASWQWIVSIDSTTSNSLPLHRAPCMSLPSGFLCVRVCVHASIDSVRTKKTYPRWEFIQLSCLLWQSWMNCQQERNVGPIYLTLIESDWLFQGTATVARLGRSCLCWLMKQRKPPHKQTEDA